MSEPSELDRLRERYPRWRFDYIAPGRIRPPTETGGVIAQHRQHRVEFYAPVICLHRLESDIAAWESHSGGETSL